MVCTRIFHFADGTEVIMTSGRMNPLWDFVRLTQPRRRFWRNARKWQLGAVADQVVQRGPCSVVDGIVQRDAVESEEARRALTIAAETTPGIAAVADYLRSASRPTSISRPNQDRRHVHGQGA